MKFQVKKGKQWNKCVLDVISDMDLSFVISRLHSGLCKKSKLKVYRELKENFECKKYLHGVSDICSKLLFRFRSGTYSLNKKLGRHSTRNSGKASFVSVSVSL